MIPLQRVNAERLVWLLAGSAGFQIVNAPHLSATPVCSLEVKILYLGCPVHNVLQGLGFWLNLPEKTPPYKMRRMGNRKFNYNNVAARQKHLGQCGNPRKTLRPYTFSSAREDLNERALGHPLFLSLGAVAAVLSISIEIS
jgi:hypothetical protein